MLELCGILGIAVNELLSEERIVMEDYRKKAEENLIDEFVSSARARAGIGA